MSSSSCPITNKLDSTLYPLSNETLLNIYSKWPNPSQTSGFTKTDFGEITPYEVFSCGEKFCVKGKAQTLIHKIFIRPEKLVGNKENPRWIPIEKFPCSQMYQKNFVTYKCTIEHEKVHFVQRDDAIKQNCSAFTKKLSSIKTDTKDAAIKLAEAAYNEIKVKVSDADQEKVPYQIEWNCNKALAEVAKIACPLKPDWTKLSLLNGLKESSLSPMISQFKKDDTVLFTAKFLKESTQLETTIEDAECKKKQWYFSYGIMDQENCFHKDGSITKVFYEFGEKLRTVLIGADGKVASQKFFTDPQNRINQD